MSKKSPVTGIPFSLIYVDELEPARTFYEKYFGFEQKMDFNDKEIYGTTGDVGMWIGAGYEKRDANDKSTRATAMFRVDSASNLFNALKTGGEKLLHDEPQKMSGDDYWFQLADPAGNVIDVLGDR